jgi:hypothetical protein
MEMGAAVRPSGGLERRSRGYGVFGLGCALVGSLALAALSGRGVDRDISLLVRWRQDALEPLEKESRGRGDTVGLGFVEGEKHILDVMYDEESRKNKVLIPSAPCLRHLTTSKPTPLLPMFTGRGGCAAGCKTQGCRKIRGVAAGANGGGEKECCGGREATCRRKSELPRAAAWWLSVEFVAVRCQSCTASDG